MIQTELRSVFTGKCVRLHDIINPIIINNNNDNYELSLLNPKNILKCSNRLNLLENLLISKEYMNELNNIRIGRIFYWKEKNCLAIKCFDKFIYFNKITLHKKMSALDFYNGYLAKNKEFYMEGKENGLDECFLF